MVTQIQGSDLGITYSLMPHQQRRQANAAKKRVLRLFHQIHLAPEMP